MEEHTAIAAEIIKEIVKREKDSGLELYQNYLALYRDSGELQDVFAFLHQRLYGGISALNNRIGWSNHYLANDSREMLQTIELLDELTEAVKEDGSILSVDKNVSQLIDRARKFLSASGGSLIPEDLEKVKITRTKKIFEYTANSAFNLIDNRFGARQLIGEGSYAKVFKLKDSFRGDYIAYKRALKTLSKKELARFRNEYQQLTKINFPYVVKAYEYDEDNNGYYLEYCDEDLYKYIRSHDSLSFYSRKAMAHQFVCAVNCLHKKGILHRDLSYKNILVKTYDGGAVQIKLADLGLCKDPSQKITKTSSSLKGTLIDPTLESFKDFTTKNEIYSVGMILQFIFTGRESIGRLDERTKHIICKCTSNNLDERYGNVRAIITEIDEL